MTVEPLAIEVKMTAFAHTFPSTAKASGVKLRDANTLDRWAAETPASDAELMTARFLLTVWEPTYEWQSGRFGLMESLREWDEHHRTVFLARAEDPSWR